MSSALCLVFSIAVEKIVIEVYVKAEKTLTYIVFFPFLGLLLACSPPIHWPSSLFFSSVNGIVIHWESSVLFFSFITLPSNHKILLTQILKYVSNISTSVHLNCHNTSLSHNYLFHRLMQEFLQLSLLFPTCYLLRSLLHQRRCVPSICSRGTLIFP